MLQVDVVVVGKGNAALCAALRARERFTANPDAFEHRQGFFNVFNGTDHGIAARSSAWPRGPDANINPHWSGDGQ